MIGTGMDTSKPFGVGVGRGGEGGGRGRSELPFDLCLPPQQFEENRRQREAVRKEMFESSAPPFTSSGEKDSSGRGGNDDDAKRQASAGGEGGGGTKKDTEGDVTTFEMEMETFPKFSLLQVSDTDQKNPDKDQDEAAAQKAESGSGSGEGCGAGASSHFDGLMKKIMGNPLIMDRWFNVCPPGVLSVSQCRLVSKDWKEKSLDRWRASTWVHISTWEGFKSFMDFVKNPENDYSKNPCRFFHLVGTGEIPLESQLLIINEFWQFCGEHITGLRLDRWAFSSLRTFRKLLYCACPNLNTLLLTYDFSVKCWNYFAVEEPEKYEEPSGHPQLHLRSLTLDMNEHPLPVSWMELLANFPGLTAIKVIKVDSKETLKKMLRAVQLIRQQDKNKLALKELDLLGAFPNSQREVPYDVRVLLLELQLPLESLAMDFGTHERIDNVKELLEAHAKTLRSLVAYRDPLSSSFLSFPCSVRPDKLEELCLPDNFTSNLEFLGGMPNLRKLHLGNGAQNRPLYKTTTIVANTSTKEAKLAGLQLPNLTELRLDYVVGVDDLRRLVKWIPNLRRLRMFLNDQQFGIVCEGWSKLEHIQVFGDELTDEGIIGRKLDLDESEVEEVAKHPRPNITWLTDLTSFLMHNGLASPTCLTEISAFECFLQMDSLLSLKLCAQISEDGIKALKAKIPHCEIIQLVWDQDEERWFNLSKTKIADQREIEKKIEKEIEAKNSKKAYENSDSDSDWSV